MAYLGEEIPKLGFGLMRIPKLEDGSADIEQLKAMVDTYMGAGLTYFDTARGYPGSEDAIRQALVERYPRDSYLLASKCAAWLHARNADEAKASIHQSLEATGVDHFDYFLLHNLGQKRTRIFDDYGMWDYMKEMREQGKMRHFGISFHDVASELPPLLEAHPEIEFVQLQVNYADWNSKNVQSRKCLEVAREYGKPVIIMEPVKGGKLAHPPQQVVDLFKAADPDASIVSWALRFAWGTEDLITVLSGMSTLEQVEENVRLLESYEPLSPAELDTIHAAQKLMDELIEVPCTTCRYCMHDCPENINIAGIMESINRAALFGEQVGKNQYMFEKLEWGDPADCMQCGQCEDACPQGIDIMARIESVAS